MTLFQALLSVYYPSHSLPRMAAISTESNDLNPLGIVSAALAQAGSYHPASCWDPSSVVSIGIPRCLVWMALTINPFSLARVDQQPEVGAIYCVAVNFADVVTPVHTSPKHSAFGWFKSTRDNAHASFGIGAMKAEPPVSATLELHCHLSI
jgi:hypothetical protein